MDGKWLASNEIIGRAHTGVTFGSSLAQIFFFIAERLELVSSLVIDRTPIVRASTALTKVRVKAVARLGAGLHEGAGRDGAFGAGHGAGRVRRC